MVEMNKNEQNHFSTCYEFCKALNLKKCHYNIFVSVILLYLMYTVSQKTWDFSDELDIVFVMS